MSFETHLLTETKNAFTKAYEAMKTFQDFFSNPSSLSNTNEDAILPYKRKIESLLGELSQHKKTNEQLHAELLTLKNAAIKRETMHNDIQQIKSQLEDIHQTFFGKNEHITHIQSKIHDTIMARSGVPPLFKIKSFNNEIRIEHIHSRNWGFSPIILSDNRVVAPSGNEGTGISICAINYETKTWEQSIKKETAHSGRIRSFLELPNNVLLSCSEDCLLKLWRLADNDLLELKCIRAHDSEITKLISLDDSCTQFASSSVDKTIVLWNGVTPFHKIAVLRCEAPVNNMLHVRSTNSLIASCHEHGLEFWDMRTRTRTQSIKGSSTTYSINSMIELPHKRVAISTNNADNAIVIIDASKCVVVKEITLKGFITHCSSLCLVDDSSFVYVYDGRVVQIAIKDFSVIYKTTTEKALNGFYGVLSAEHGKYMLISNNTNGINVVSLIFT